MNLCCIFHSESGHTRGIADRCLAATGGDRIEVRYLPGHHLVTKILFGGRLARKDPLHLIEPSRIDVSKYDLMVIGSPVWGGKPTPATTAAIQALEGCGGKKAVLFVTCGGSPGESLSLMKGALEGRGVAVAASMAFTRNELRDEGRVNDLIGQIRSAGTG